MITILVCYEVIQSGRSSGGHTFLNVESLTVDALLYAQKVIAEQLRQSGFQFEGNVVFRSITPLVG